MTADTVIWIFAKVFTIFNRLVGIVCRENRTPVAETFPIFGPIFKTSAQSFTGKLSSDLLPNYVTGP